MADMQFHEIAGIFPLMVDEDFDGLVEDIRKQGLNETIKLYEGKILDGRNRYRACLLAGQEPRYEGVEPEDPIAYVNSANRYRRHLTQSQLAASAVLAQDFYRKLQAEARERQRGGLKRGDEKPVVATLPQREPGKTRDILGKAFGVGGRTIDDARKVKEKGEPELFEALKSGHISASGGAALATEPREVQLAAIDSAMASPKPKPKKGESNGKQTVDVTPGKLIGVGVIKANEAINALARIPRKDPLRQRGFQMVKDWIKDNP